MFQIGQSCKGLLQRSHLAPLRVSFCPPQPSPSHPNPSLTFPDLLSCILPMCVRAGQESREAFRSWRAVSRVWTASDCSVLHPPNLPPPLFALFACNQKPVLSIHTHTHSGQMIVTEHQMICSAGIDQRSWIAQSLNQEHYDPKIKLKEKDILQPQPFMGS